jgi:hypothetical protein
MKRKPFKHLSILTAACALLIGTPAAKAGADLSINTFSADGSTAGFWKWWGGISQTITWDPSVDASNNVSSGSARIDIVFDSTIGVDDQYSIGMSLAGTGSYNGSVVASPSAYKALEFDILWSTNNTVAIDAFNTTGDAGFNLGLTGTIPAGGGVIAWNQDFLSPAPTLTATGKWQHVVIPIPVTKPDFAGLVFKKWTPGDGTGLNGTATVWIDNIKLTGSDAPPPVPSMTIKKSDLKGLQLTANGAGQYQRQNLAATSAEAQATWWIDNPNPVTYTMSVVDAPLIPGFQNHLFLSVDSGGGNSPDYSDPTVVFLDIRRNADATGNATFRYKVNQPNGNAMLYGTGAIASLGTTTAIGTWSLKFQNNTNITLTGPDGSSTNFNMSATDAESFRPSVGMTASFGVQPNQAAFIGQSSTFGEFKITSGATTVLNDTFNTVYNGGQGPVNPDLWTRRMENIAGIAVLTGSGYFVSWGVPDLGYSLLASSNLNSSWYDLAVPVTQAGTTKSAFVASTNLPAGNNGFFVLQQRTATKLQVLLPGETAAPGTPTGKTGTPTAQIVATDVPVTVNAVTATWQRVNGVGDTILLTSTDETMVVPATTTLANGTGTFIVQFTQAGTFTISATNTTGTVKAPAKSGSVVVGP